MAYPTQWVQPKLNVSFENIKNHIYFDADGSPQQAGENIQVLAADVQLNVTTPWVNLDNHAIYQYTSSNKLPLPALTLYHNLYYHGCWFKALDTQIGVDMLFYEILRAHTKSGLGTILHTRPGASRQLSRNECICQLLCA